jgi:beta-galactosidase
VSMKQIFNNDWFFSKQPLHTNYESVSQSDSWYAVTLPHDWLIYDSNDLYEDGEGWYHKTIERTEIDPHTIYTLYFEGVYMDSTLYVNDHEVGTWKNGYSSFEMDITPYLIEGMNEIYVQVIHETPNSRWYSGAGIYRSVWLKTYPTSHIVPQGIYVSTMKDDTNWHVEVETEIVIDAVLNSASSYKLRNSIVDEKQTLVAQSEVQFNADDRQVGSTIIVYNPLVWDIIDPNLYTLQTELIIDDRVIDEEQLEFGFRTMTFDQDKGFFLNGRHVRLNGVCQHHDLGSLGAAVNRVALKRQLTLLQEMGVNAIRTAHNMPAVELMELADEMGLLIVSEAFDMWERPKNPYDYARFFPEWWERDIASWVRRDRNHPSMLMWSIGNEIYDTHANERGQEITRELLAAVQCHDPKENAAVTIGSNYMPWENAQQCADIVKFAGYNYAEKYYESHHQEHPDWFIYGSETSSTVQSRGIYHFPLGQSVLSDDDEQCSSLGNSSTSWGAKSTERCIIDDRDAAFSLGQFIWTGFDYIGEPTPYSTKNSYFGQLDTAGFKKDSFYIYQAEWTDYKLAPMVHIFPYWDFSDGQMIDIRVCSNAPKIELFFNDESQGVINIDHAHGQELLGEWQLPYTNGTLKAVAYDENDQVIATDIQRSFGDAATIIQTTDKTILQADGSDLIFMEISSNDIIGNHVANANNRVYLTVEGPARLVGLDNGDSTDYDSYKGNNRRLFSGKLLAIIASTNEPGTIVVTASSKGLPASKLTLSSVAHSNVSEANEELALYGISAMHDALQPNSELDQAADEIPVRKLEIIYPEGNQFSPEKNTLRMTVNIHPSDASYQDVEWRVTNVAGVESNLATIQANGHEATVTALGDGKIYIRCATKNGSKKIKQYSLLEMEIQNLGQAFINPYEFVSAAYHSDKSYNLSNGNERGMATSRDGESLIGFERIDFGQYGSNEITLPIFSLDNDQLSIEIWEGAPGEDRAELLTTVSYQKPSIWNTYQEETYTLPKTLTGVTSIYFVLHHKIHLKGLQFKKILKGFERLSALDKNVIYGDSFTMTLDAIEHIGNNVSLVFEEMDFGEIGSRKLVIQGHSPIDHNTIHVLFNSEQGESKQLVEFDYSEGYCEREYNIEQVKGLQTVTFIFLPGSQFNFKSFQFHIE